MSLLLFTDITVLTLPAITKRVPEMSSQKSRVESFINMSLMALLLNEGLQLNYSSEVNTCFENI